MKLIGLCSGEYYVRRRSKSRYGGWLRKKVDCTFTTHDKKIDFCPTCGHALFWSKTGIPFLTLEELRAMSDREDEVMTDLTVIQE